MTDEDFRQFTRSAVRRGVELLDERRPGWRDEIDWETLNMRSAFTCILGQLFDPGPGSIVSGYWQGLEELFNNGGEFFSDDEGGKPDFFGFNVHHVILRGDCSSDYEFLKSLWIQEAGVSI